MKTKRLAALLFAVTMITSALSLPQLPTNAADVRKFDLGGNAQSGWMSVSASTGYDKNKGYGFGGSGVKNVGASGKNELSDAVQFTDWTTTFNVDLPKGLYRVKVTLGNTSRTSVYMENMIQIVNMTGNNAVDQILIPVTDGQLNIRAGAGKDGTAFSISALEIEKVSDDPTLPPTIWICGDSTVCNYYPLDTSTQGGWGQMLGHYVDKGWNIRNMAASGQWAKGFMDAGQFTPIETYGKPGDVYIISIGINDSKYYKGDEYQKYITDMTQRAKKKGMEVILVKQQGRNGDAQRSPLLERRWYAWELDQVAAQENVQAVDLFKLWQDYCIQIGPDKTTQLYMNGDTLHPNRAGAEKLAELFATQFKQTPGSTEPFTDAPTEPPTEPEPLHGRLIREVQIFDTANAAAWSIREGLHVGDAAFGDRAFRFTAVPDHLADAEVLSTACNSKKFATDQAQFTVAEDVTVYLGVDTRLEPPAWLSAWTKTADTLTDDGNPVVTYQVWKRDVKAEEAVTIGINGDSGTVNYVIAVKPYAPESTEPPTTEAPTEPVPVIGDVNADGTPDVRDLILVQKYLLGISSLTSEQFDIADLNTDECVDVFDLALLKRILLNRSSP
ncbi:MAG: hypothetical protein J5851_00545 [Oscillospiraceae bacterium]|nr:hypothetical protein [Oscillospiraceae bacterium]